MGLVKGLAMEKGLCWAALGVSSLMLIVFALDLFIKQPFGGLNRLVDILAVLSSGMLIYLSWNALRDQR